MVTEVNHTYCKPLPLSFLFPKTSYLVVRKLDKSQKVSYLNPCSDEDVCSGSYSTLNGDPYLYAILMRKMTVVLRTIQPPMPLPRLF